MDSTPVLFLPGTLCDERIWLPVWRQLSITQRRYVPLQWATSLEDMLALTGDRVLDGEKVHLVGFSMGGYIASKWALQNSDKVASLTLVGYNPEGLGVDEINRRKQMVSMLQNGQFQPDNPAYLKNFVHPDFMPSEQVSQVITDMGQDLGKATLIAHTQSTTPREDMVPALRKAPFHLNLVAAIDDAVVPFDKLTAVAAELNHCTLYPIKDAAHMMPLEQPEELASVLRQVLDRTRGKAQ